jgi:(2S)-methylsuccinyl-CoA dehydrogenase
MESTEKLLSLCESGLTLAEQFLATCRHAVACMVGDSGKPDPALLELHQLAAHGFAWQSTYVEALRQALRWARGLQETGALSAVEAAILRLGFAEFLAQLGGGIPISQTEMVRPGDLGVPASATLGFVSAPVLTQLADPAALDAARKTIVAGALDGQFGTVGLDETHQAIRDQFLRYAATEIAPYAQQWHQNDELIPLPVVQQLAEMGVFGMTVPEESGGLGLGKVAMCVVSEALSGGYIGVGSLGTRAEIAAELIGSAGTPEQKQRWLGPIVTGAVLATAVFTEPNTGSDLANLRTRAVRDCNVYHVTGA